jgi:hypothetical protein
LPVSGASAWCRRTAAQVEIAADEAVEPARLLQQLPKFAT